MKHIKNKKVYKKKNKQTIIKEEKSCEISFIQDRCDKKKFGEGFEDCTCTTQHALNKKKCNKMLWIRSCSRPQVTHHYKLFVMSCAFTTRKIQSSRDV